jgi:hypothetical protein
VTELAKGSVDIPVAMSLPPRPPSSLASRKDLPVSEVPEPHHQVMRSGGWQLTIPSQITQLARLAQAALPSLEVPPVTVTVPAAVVSAVALSAGARWLVSRAASAVGAAVAAPASGPGGAVAHGLLSSLASVGAAHNQMASCAHHTGLIPASVTNVFIVQRGPPPVAFLLIMMTMLMLLAAIMMFCMEDLDNAAFGGSGGSPPGVGHY